LIVINTKREFYFRILSKHRCILEFYPNIDLFIDLFIEEIMKIIEEIMKKNKLNKILVNFLTKISIIYYTLV